jgi:hypothetical protein
MKRGGFIKRRTPLRSTQKSSKNRPRKLATKGYVVPAWFNAIPLGSHGSNPAQKRLWKVCSDTYRLEDWTEDPRCRACGTELESWKDGHLGHFKKYSLCNSWFKFDRMNLSLICPACNYLDDGPTLFAFGNYLCDKYGPNHIARIEIENEAQRGKKMEVWEIVAKVQEIAPHLAL